MMSNNNIGNAKPTGFMHAFWREVKMLAAASILALLKINIALRKGTDPIFYKKSKAIVEYASFLLGGTQPAHPLKVFVEVSNLCNIKCVFCNTFSVVNELKTEVLKTTERGLFDIEILRKQSSFMSHALWVPLMGYGESTMHKQFIEMLEFLGESGLRINFFTNGTNLTDALAQAIVKNNVADVTISFSGINKEQYETVYHGADFDKVLAGIKRIQEYKIKSNSKLPQISINSIAFHDHVSSFDKFVELMADHGVSVITLTPLYTYGFEAGYGINLHDYAADSGDPRFVEIIKRAKAIALQRAVEIRDTFSSAPANSESVSSITGVPIKVLSEKIEQRVSPVKFKSTAPVEKSGGAFDLKNVSAKEIKEILEIPDSPNQEGFICGEPFSTFYIDVNGQIKPCCNMPLSRFPGDKIKMLGDINQASSEEIWAGLPYTMLRENILNSIYPEAVCGYCMKHKAAPPSSIVDIVLGYLNWYVKVRPGNAGYAASVKVLFHALAKISDGSKIGPR